MGELKLPQMFIGTKDLTVDDKGRVFVPAKYRGALGDSVVICKDMFNDCLSMYTVEAFYKLAMSLQEKPRNIQDVSDVILEFIGNAEEVSMDKQGRVMIPSALREMTGIERSATIVGSINHFNIWNPDALKNKKKDINLSKAARDLAGIGIEIN